MALIILAALAFAIIGIKRRLSIRPPRPEQQNIPADHPVSFTASPDVDEESQRRVVPPPSYEEAAKSQSHSNISIPPLWELSAEPYDSTGLPSYDEVFI